MYVGNLCFYGFDFLKWFFIEFGWDNVGIILNLYVEFEFLSVDGIVE